MSRQVITVLFVLAVLSVGLARAQNGEGYIYGKVTLKSDNTYQGVMRWGKEEAFWDDMFNSAKVDNALDVYLTGDDWQNLKDELSRGRRKRRSWWRRDDWRDIVSHQFKCRFGDLARIEIQRRKELRLFFKNGDEMLVSGGSNDVGADIRILDEEIGEVKLKWRRIESIEFMPTPRKLQNTFGEPLYGEVETRRGRFEGFIQWDHEECLSTDLLDGEHEDGKMSIAFGKIRSIKKHRRGSLVTLKSGREFYLDDSNDVDRDNRGVVIKDPRIGKVLVDWREFKEVRFRDKPAKPAPAYRDFAAPKQLTGTIKTEDGESMSGRILYDLDEALDLEILDGEDRGIQYRIPLRNIKKIIPDGRYESVVQLRSGLELHLEESRDVSRENDGILVFNDAQVRYIPWDEVEEVELR